MRPAQFTTRFELEERVSIAPRRALAVGRVRFLWLDCLLKMLRQSISW